MIDIKIDSSGDFVVGEDGDLSLTGEYVTQPTNEAVSACIAQMAYMAIKTERGDLTLHPTLGQELYKILGLPNKDTVAEKGSNLIIDAIKSWGVLHPISVEYWPEELNVIGYEVKIKVGEPGRYVTIKLNQALDEIGTFERV